MKSSLGLLLMLVVGSEAEGLSEALKQTKVEGYRGYRRFNTSNLSSTKLNYD